MPTAKRNISALREFNRFYTKEIGVLGEGPLDSSYSLSEARLLYELGQRGRVETKALREALEIDRGYLSRILARFEADRLLNRRRSQADGRRQLVELSARGRRVAKGLDERSSEQAGERLGALSGGERERLLAAMATIRGILDPLARPARVALRAPRAGELGWVISRHGAVYSHSYGWDESFEALVAQIVADFAAGRQDGGERAWIATLGGAPAGCIFCTRKDAQSAQLRLLLVERWARGRGIGGRLVGECVAFARASGYQRLVLWTNDILVEARKIYEAAGFGLISEERHRSFGQELTGQDWELELS